MPMNINCSNKGCYKTDAHVLDITSNDVYCISCGNVIPNISQFTKAQLKNLKQTKRPPKGAYAIQCVKCKVEALPKLQNNELVCQGCSNPLTNISKPFQIIIRNIIKKGDEEL